MSQNLVYSFSRAVWGYRYEQKKSKCDCTLFLGYSILPKHVFLRPLAVNMAARMESTGIPNKIHASQETADLLKEAGHGKWLFPRSEEVYIKGRGNLPTYMVQITCGSKGDATVASTAVDDQSALPDTSTKTESLIAWNVQALSDLLRKIVARRAGMKKQRGRVPASSGQYSAPLSEVEDVIKLPEYQACAVKAQVNPDTIELDEAVVGQLQSLVTRIAATYRYVGKGMG